MKYPGGSARSLSILARTSSTKLPRSRPRTFDITTIRRCPRLHAKAVIIDANRIYLGSANLTGAGLGAKSDGRRNFEMGIWTDSSAMIDAVMEQFNALWEGARCGGCQRRDVCPVPLEEPADTGLLRVQPGIAGIHRLSLAQDREGRA